MLSDKNSYDIVGENNEAYIISICQTMQFVKLSQK